MNPRWKLLLSVTAPRARARAPVTATRSMADGSRAFEFRRRVGDDASELDEVASADGSAEAWRSGADVSRGDGGGSARHRRTPSQFMLDALRAGAPAGEVPWGGDETTRGAALDDDDEPAAAVCDMNALMATCFAPDSGLDSMDDEDPMALCENLCIQQLFPCLSNPMVLMMLPPDAMNEINQLNVMCNGDDSGGGPADGVCQIGSLMAMSADPAMDPDSCGEDVTCLCHNGMIQEMLETVPDSSQIISAAPPRWYELDRWWPWHWTTDTKRLAAANATKV